MSLFKIFLCLLFFSCGTKTPINLILHNEVKMEKEIVPHIIEFERQCGIKVEIPIVFGSMYGTIIGACYGFWHPNFLRHIRIDWDYWNKADYYEREALVFHELGHCVLNRLHRNEKNGIVPMSNMIDQEYSSSTYRSRRQYYINELCEDKKISLPFNYNETKKLYPIESFPFSHDKVGAFPERWWDESHSDWNNQ